MVSKKVNTVLFNFLRGFSPTIFNFVIALLGYTYCGADNWGEIIGIMLILFLFNFAASWGNREHLIRAYSESPADIYNLFFESLATRSIFLLTALGLFLIYSPYTAILCFLIILVRYFYSSMESLVIYQQRFRAQFLTEVFGFVIILGAILWNDKFSIHYFLMVYFISGLGKALLLGLILKPTPQKGTALFNKALLIATIPFFLISLSGWLHSKVDLYLVEFNLSTAHLSKYQILVGAYLMLDAVSAFMVQPFSKYLYRLNAITISKMRRLLRWLALPIVLIGSGSIYLFLEHFTAIRFDNSIYLLMTIGSIPPFFYMVDIFMLYRRKKEKQIMSLSFLGAFVNLSIGLLLIPDYGIFGAVIGVCCSKWIMIFIPLLVKNDHEIKSIES